MWSVGKNKLRRALICENFDEISKQSQMCGWCWILDGTCRDKNDISFIRCPERIYDPKNLRHFIVLSNWMVFPKIFEVDLMTWYPCSPENLNNITAENRCNDWRNSTTSNGHGQTNGVSISSSIFHQRFLSARDQFIGIKWFFIMQTSRKKLFILCLIMFPFRIC